VRIYNRYISGPSVRNQHSALQIFTKFHIQTRGKESTRIKTNQFFLSHSSFTWQYFSKKYPVWGIYMIYMSVHNLQHVRRGFWYNLPRFWVWISLYFSLFVSMGVKYLSHFIVTTHSGEYYLVNDDVITSTSLNIHECTRSRKYDG